MNNRILYFVEGVVPTNEEFEKAAKYANKGPFLEFVSLQQIDLSGELLDNVGVAGKVPNKYKSFSIIDKSVKVKIEKE